MMNKLKKRALKLCNNIKYNADDLYQETHFKFCKYYPEFDGTDEEQLRLMYTIMLNIFLDHKKKKHEEVFSDLEVQDQDGEFLAWEPIGTFGDVNYNYVYDMINALPSKVRDAANLVLLQGFSYQKCADTLCITYSAVTNRLNRAKYLIRKELMD